jgi:hypothetical protein
MSQILTPGLLARDHPESDVCLVFGLRFRNFIDTNNYRY